MSSVAIVGGAGYTGGELIRLLLNHPFAELTEVVSKSQAGKRIDEVHKDLWGETDLRFSNQLETAVDVVFLCLGHGKSLGYLTQHELPGTTKIIDLSQDHRASEDFVYGLPELHKSAIAKAGYVANPGCFATALTLALLPLAHNGALGEVHVSGITGSTGAGMSPSETTHFSWRSGNISTYKPFSHQHMAEVQRALHVHQPWHDKPVNFIPYRGNFPRGILMTAYQYSTWPLEEVQQVYQEYYADHPFTHVVDGPLDLKQVLNTNKCFICLEMHNGYLMIQSVIDNLLKGASGQAVQNMNLMMGWEEKTGLQLKPSAF